jgi:multidrug efflux system membrane fusion protein
MVAFVVADCSRMKAVFGVPERVAALLRVGQPLEVQGEAAAAEPLSGRITAVAPSADTQSRVFNVEVTVPNPGGHVRAGTIATVRVPVAGPSARAALAGVPLSAVVRSRAKADGYAVFVVEDDKGRPVVRARDVELGDIAGNLIHVAAGLEPRDRVVVTGASLVSDGEPVRVLE